MTTTLNNLTAAAIASSTSDASSFVSVVVTLLLLVLLVLKELLRSTARSRANLWAHTLNIAIVPLLLAFGCFVAVRFLDLLS